ncbi:helix-turn-helix transcriptional regulator [Herbidospora sp. RD11066]
MSGTNLTIRRRQLASRLKSLRQQSRMTLETVAALLHSSTAKISRLETGQRGASVRDVQDLCAIYGVTDVLFIAELISMARDSRQQVLRQEFGDIGDDAVYTYMDLEAAATAITEVEISYVPGLLQTEDYARALIRGIVPTLSASAVERRIKARLHRQRLLRDDPPLDFRSFLDEGALWRHIGGPKTMCGQIDHLVEITESGRISLQIMPFTMGAYTGMDSPFVLFQLPEPDASIVYLESVGTVEYTEKPSEVAVYLETVQRLKETALSPGASITLLKGIKAAFQHSEAAGSGT